VNGEHNQVVIWKRNSDCSSVDLKDVTEIDIDNESREQFEFDEAVASESGRSDVEMSAISSFTPNELFDYVSDQFQPKSSKIMIPPLSSMRPKVEEVLDMTVTLSSRSPSVYEVGSDQFWPRRPNSVIVSLSSLGSEDDDEFDLSVGYGVMGVNQQQVTQDNCHGKHGSKRKKKKKKKKSKCSNMFFEWLQPIPEKEYMRVIYVGKLQTAQIFELDPKSNELEKEDAVRTMISEVWKVAQKFNSSNFISGHLAFTRGLYVAQLLEGSGDIVGRLMERIRKDTRVVIEKEFMNRILTMNSEFKVSMCYSFAETTVDVGMINDPNVSLDQFFENIENSYQIKRSGWDLQEFYRSIVEMTLMKYVALDLRNEER